MRALRTAVRNSAVFLSIAVPSQLAVAELQPAVATPTAAAVQRLTPEQYANIITSLFGQDINLGGRFEESIRSGGLLQAGTSQATISASGAEQVHTMAKSIAAQVVDARHRDLLIPCKPQPGKLTDDSCARQFLGRVGEQLFRRPLGERELESWVKQASQAAADLGDFYSGLASSLTGMLQSPAFLFRMELPNTQAAANAPMELDAYAKASKLSFFLWNAGPDPALYAAARAGKLDRPEGIAAQVDRMLASPRTAEGTRAFFSDMLELDQLAYVAKDSAIYPNFTADVLHDAREQTLQTIVDILIRGRGDYREIFTSRRTFLTPLLGSLYQVPVASTAPRALKGGWQPYEYPAGDPRAGILSHISFVAMHSHAGRSSVTLRGKAVRELIMCQKVPPPPGTVSFEILQDTSNPTYKTARARLRAHTTNPVCAGCHKLTDPLGYPLEVFDASGAFRETENGEKLDLSGSLGGKKFATTNEFASVVSNDPATASCLVNRVYAYALGRPVGSEDKAVVDAVKDDFASNGYRYVHLLRSVATSETFFRAASR
jgi:hypothetical protein